MGVAVRALEGGPCELKVEAVSYSAAISACEKGVEWFMSLELLKEMLHIILESGSFSIYDEIHGSPLALALNHNSFE